MIRPLLLFLAALGFLALALLCPAQSEPVPPEGHQAAVDYVLQGRMDHEPWDIRAAGVALFPDEYVPHLPPKKGGQ